MINETPEPKNTETSSTPAVETEESSKESPEEKQNPSQMTKKQSQTISTSKKSIKEKSSNTNTSSNPKGETVEKIMQDKPKEITTEEYEENVSSLKKVTIKDIQSSFIEKKEQILYIGRSTCYYCRQFSPELKKFNELINNQLNYYSNEGKDYDEDAANFIFNELGIPGTPTTLHIKNGEILNGWVGGEITAQELYNFFFPLENEQVNLDVKSDLPASKIPTSNKKENNESAKKNSNFISNRVLLNNNKMVATKNKEYHQIKSKSPKRKIINKRKVINKNEQKKIQTHYTQKLPQLGEPNHGIYSYIYGIVISFLALLILFWEKFFLANYSSKHYI